jgi:hypothetical protein
MADAAPPSQPQPATPLETFSMPRTRPFGVTLLLWMVLMLLIWGGVRFFAALRTWNVLLEYESSLSPLYLAATGAGWGLAGGVLLWGVLVRRAWTHRALTIILFVGLIQYWLERMVFAIPRVNLPFAVTASVLIAGLILFILQHRSTTDFLTKSEAYEQPIETSDPE